MAFFDKYPYTDFHELNLDWLIAQMKALEEHVDNTYQELYNELSHDLKGYIDDEIASILSEFTTLKAQFIILQQQFTDLKNVFDAYELEINDKIVALNLRITNEIQGVNDRTDVLIASNNQFLLDTMSEHLRNMTVINFFTGEETTIQNMFNYLANLHLSDGIAYNQITARGYTYGSIAALNLTYSDIIMHGNTLLP